MAELQEWRVEEEIEEAWLRKGPEPLLFHLSTAMSRCAAGEISQEDFTRFTAGIQKYQKYPFRRQVTLFDRVWHKDDVSLYHIPAVKNVKRKASLFVVPSLINRSYIFDLLPHKSFVRWMAQNGIDIFLLDWGDFQHSKAPSSLPDIYDEYMVHAISFARSMAADKFYGLGYCMGGTLLASAASVNPVLLSGVVLLASPWDFHAGNQALTNRIKAAKFEASQTMAQKNVLPVSALQGVFASLDPDHLIRKFSQFLDLEAGSDAEKIFVAVEDWLHDGQDIPSGIAQCMIYDWYDNNLLQKGQWRFSAGNTVRPENIEVPVLIVTSKRDRLVPYQSSAALATQLFKSDILVPDCGHIGFMAGHNAERQVWLPVLDWIENNTQ